MEIDTVRKRLLIRSWRRGTKELDLILGKFSNNNVSKLEMTELDVYEQLLSNDDYVFIIGYLERRKSQKFFTISSGRYKRVCIDDHFLGAVLIIKIFLLFF